jgi:hypothetical protein
MSDVLELPFQPLDGKIPTAVMHRLLDAVAKMDGKRLILALREQKRRRSLNQNAYYWGVVLPPILQMFREAGNGVDAEDVHTYLKEHVGKLKQVFVTKDGEVLTGAGSTAKLSTQEMEVYLDRVRAWAAEYGVAIPLPNEQLS